MYAAPKGPSPRRLPALVAAWGHGTLVINSVINRAPISVRWYGLSVLKLAAARQALGPYRTSVFTTPVLNAVATWREFVRQSPHHAKPMDETTRANMIHCWWREGVRQALVDLSGIREIESLGFFAVAVGANPLVRFKLLGGGGRPSNVNTDQQVRLSCQEYDEDSLDSLTLEGIPAPPTLLTCGYSLDAVAEINSVEIRCEYRPEPNAGWRWVIWGEAAGGISEIEQLPLFDIPGPQPARVKSAKRRDAQGQQDAK